MRNIITLAMLAFASEAYAQDTIDAHGFYMSPSDGDIHDPLRTWRAEAHGKNSFGVNILGEYAYRPLVRYSQTGDTVTRSIEVQDLAALNVGLFYSPHERLALTLTTPLFLAVESQVASSGVGVGDFRLSAPVGILLDQDVSDDVSLSLSVVPHLDIPGVYQDQYFQSSGLSGGGVVAATIGDDRWQASANVGGHFAPEVEIENITGNERLILGASGSYAVVDDLAVRGEVTMLPPFSKNDVPWTNSPVEVTGSVRGYANHVLGWTAGASTALSKGVGAATFRAFLGLDIALGARNQHVCEACQPVTIVHHIVDSRGQDVPDATITIDGVDTQPDVVSELTPGDHFAVVTVPNDDIIYIEGDVIYLLQPIYFDFDKATIRLPESTDILAALVGVLDNHQELTLIEVAGHTDSRGSDEYNLGLSQRRMNSVVEYLVQHGIDSKRLSAIGYGERELLNDACGKDEDCHQLNRRVEFKILERSED